jgi:hypothetical protein
MNTAHEFWESAVCHLLYAAEYLIIYTGKGFFTKPALHYILWCDEKRIFG